jgi:hypothetical protein
LTTCPTCGANNAFDSKFCSQCATQLGGGAAPVDPGAPRVVNTPRPAYSPYPMPGAMPYGYDAPRSSNATTILVLGILSLVVCAVMGPIAWWMGKTELNAIDAGLVSQQDRGTVNAGYICGIIGSVLMMISILFVLFFLVMLPH